MTSIHITTRELHFREPATTSRGVYTTHLSYYIHISRTTPDGRTVTGVGEASVLPDLSIDAMPRVRYEQTLTDICALVQSTGSVPYDILRPYPSICFAIETALAQLDAGGSEALYDTPFARGEQPITINGLVWMGNAAEMTARMEQKLADGFGCVKLKIGAIDFDDELAMIRTLRQRFGPDSIQLRVDANGAFTPDNVMQHLDALAPYHIHSIEQPIAAGQWQEMGRVCRQTPIAVALDEELIRTTMPQMRNAMLDEIQPQYLVLKPSLHGGMHGCNEWIRMAQTRGIGTWMTSALESNVGLNAIAHYCALTYGPHCTLPQGLGTGLLYTDNLPTALSITGDKLWFGKHAATPTNTSSTR